MTHQWKRKLKGLIEPGGISVTCYSQSPADSEARPIFLTQIAALTWTFAQSFFCHCSSGHNKHFVTVQPDVQEKIKRTQETLLTCSTSHRTSIAEGTLICNVTYLPEIKRFVSVAQIKFVFQKLCEL